MSFILALNRGATSSRALVFDRAGNVAARTQSDTVLLCPNPGWVETDPAALWESTLAVARQALVDVGATRIDAIGIANQRETTLLQDRASGAPLHNAIV